MKTGTKKMKWFLRPDVLYLLCVLGVCFGLVAGSRRLS